VKRKVYWLLGVTIIWMVAESIIALDSAIETHSVSILAFGSDSIAELLSARVALLGFIPQFHISEERTAKWGGILLVLLCIMVMCEAILSGSSAVSRIASAQRRSCRSAASHLCMGVTTEAAHGGCSPCAFVSPRSDHRSGEMSDRVRGSDWGQLRSVPSTRGRSNL
jgi:hypothetical protein